MADCTVDEAVCVCGDCPRRLLRADARGLRRPPLDGLAQCLTVVLLQADEGTEAHEAAIEARRYLCELRRILGNDMRALLEESIRRAS